MFRVCTVPLGVRRMRYVLRIFVEAVTNKLTFGYAGVHSLCVLNVDNARDYQSDLVGVIPLRIFGSPKTYNQLP